MKTFKIGRVCNLQVPCYECKERVIGCHASCTKYADYKANCAAAKAQKIEENKGKRIADNYVFESKCRHGKG